MTKPLQCRWAVSILLISALVAGCTRRFDAEQTAAKIQSELEQVADLSIQAIACPEAIAVEPEATFRCTGELASGQSFVVDVTQTSQPGQVRWTVPSSEGLLNLRDLEQHFQKELAAETLSVPMVSCGGNYRLNQVGDRFDCRVINGILNNQTKVEKITVTIAAQQNVTWQQVRQQLVVSQPGQAEKPTAEAAPTAIASPQPAPDLN